jgi:uncharacterized protein
VRIVVDTNVFVSGIFFTGPPHRILLAWRDRKVQLLVSAAILDEYHRVKDELATQFSGANLAPFLQLLTVQAEVIQAPPLAPVIQQDPSDDRFLECAVAGKADCTVSGDKHLLKLVEFQGIPILKPAAFVKKHL